MTAEREGLAEVLREHFVMWHDLPKPLLTTLPTPPGEWRCQCGLKFGFSDSAIDHQADALADLLAARDRRVRAEAVASILREVSDQTDSIGHHWSGAPALAFFALAGDLRDRADRIENAEIAQSAAATEENRP